MTVPAPAAIALRDAEFADMRAAMVDCQLRPCDIVEPRLVAAFSRVPREAFVPAARQAMAYADRAIPLGGGRVLSAPLVTARLIDAAAVRAGDKVMLIGSASGYAAAILAALGAVVTALDVSDDLTAMARAALSGTADITLVNGALADGCAARAPYDAIIIDGAIAELPDALAAQLRSGGRLVAARREGPVARLVRGVKVGDSVTLHAFADMDAADLPGFERPAVFQF
jgi:protein-L-isoaspartate(D-aspartate) O-methyltransferase